MSLSYRHFSFLTLVIGMFLCPIGCKQDTTKPVPPAAQSKALPSSGKDDDMTAVNEFLKKDKTGSASTPKGTTLPPNHPSMGGAATPTAGSGASGELPSGHPPLNQGAGNMAPGAAPGQDAINYSPPAEWKQQPVTSQMRKAQYLIPHAADDKEDGLLVVFYFGQGQGGAVEDNIDRWKGMFSTADGKPVGENEFKRESHDVNGLRVTTLDITGRYVDSMAGRTAAAPQDWRMLSAIVETPQGPWFFKGVGPIATMKAQEQNFKSFVASVKSKS